MCGKNFPNESSKLYSSIRDIFNIFHLFNARYFLIEILTVEQTNDTIHSALRNNIKLPSFV